MIFITVINDIYHCHHHGTEPEQLVVNTASQLVWRKEYLDQTVPSTFVVSLKMYSKLLVTHGCVESPKTNHHFHLITHKHRG